MKIFLNNVIIFNYILINDNTLLTDLLQLLQEKKLLEDSTNIDYYFINKGIILEKTLSFKEYHLTNEDYIVIVKQQQFDFEKSRKISFKKLLNLVKNLTNEPLPSITATDNLLPIDSTAHNTLQPLPAAEESGIIIETTSEIINPNNLNEIINTEVNIDNITNNISDNINDDTNNNDNNSDTNIINENENEQNEKLKQLNFMGFHDNIYNKQLLTLFNNNIEQVINFLVSGQ